MELYSRSKSENLKLFFNYSLVISAIRNFTQLELLYTQKKEQLHFSISILYLDLTTIF